MNQITQKLSLVVRGVDIVAWISQQDSEQWVAVRPICEAMGINWPAQYSKIKRDPKFSCRDIATTAGDGKNYDMLCIPVRQISGWLYGINSRKVSPEVAPVLLAFQEELQVSLHEIVTGHITPERFYVLEKKLEQALTIIMRQSQQIEQLIQNQDSFSHAADHLASSASYGLHAAKKTKQLRLVH